MAILKNKQTKKGHLLFSHPSKSNVTAFKTSKYIYHCLSCLLLGFWSSKVITIL